MADKPTCVKCGKTNAEIRMVVTKENNESVCEDCLIAIAKGE